MLINNYSYVKMYIKYMNNHHKYKIAVSVGYIFLCSASFYANYKTNVLLDKSKKNRNDLYPIIY